MPQPPGTSIGEGLRVNRFPAGTHARDDNGPTLDKPTAGILLAAGSSTRMGRPKQLVRIGGDLLLSRVLKVAIASDLERVVLVLGHRARTIQAALGDEQAHPKVRIVINDRHREGMSTSLQAGLAAVRECCPAIMVLLADQPFVDTAVVNRLLRSFHHSGKGICVPVHGGRRGLPVCFRHPFYDAIMQISGDRGARDIIRDHPEQVLQVNIDNPDCFYDIDTKDDLDAGHRRLTCRP